MLEIVAGVFFSLGEQATLYHVEDDFAEVGAIPDAPFLEHGYSHRAVLLKRVLADAFKQFLAGHMANSFFVLAADEFLGIIKRLAGEMIGVARKPRVLPVKF